MKNTLAWILWASFSVSLLLSTRNPIYLTIVIICQLTLGTFISTHQARTFWLKTNLRFVLTMIGISALINILFVHTGQTTVLTLPQQWWLIGGDLTIESLIVGVINGLIIGALYLTFNVLNLALSIKQMTRLIPAALKPIAMTVTVALTFFPSVQERAREIKEAQMIRGNPMNRIGDWLPLILPLLVTSLEKAFLLAESMTARGFHLQQSGYSGQGVLIGLVLGTFAVFSGWILRLYDYPAWITLSLYGIGGLLFLFGFWISRQKAAISRYHHEGWSWKDLLATALFISATLALFLLRTTPALASLVYTPYPSIDPPALDWAAIMLSLLPAAPVLMRAYD